MPTNFPTGLESGGVSLLIPNYAGIGVANNASATIIRIKNNWHLVQVFDTNAPDAVSTSDQANEKVEVGVTSDYKVEFCGSGEAAAGNKTFEYSVWEITAATKAISGVTINAIGKLNVVAHGYSNGDIVKVTGITGTDTLNDRLYRVAAQTTDEFAIQDDEGVAINTSGFASWSSGGTCQIATETLAHTDRKYSVGGGGDFGAFTGCFICTLTQGNQIELYIKGTSDATNFTFENCTMVIGRAG